MINQIQPAFNNAYKLEPQTKQQNAVSAEQPLPMPEAIKVPSRTLKAYGMTINFTARREGQKYNSLRTDLSGLEQIDKEHGIDINKAFKENQSILKAAVDRIYDDKNKEGQWLKWIDLSKRRQEGVIHVQEIKDYVDNKVKGKFDDVVVVGIGGSSLGAKALVNALADAQWNIMTKEQRKGLPRMHFLENIDPDRYSEVVDKLNMKKTLICVISKSGKTPETSANYLNLQERMVNVMGKKSKDHIVAVTDKDPAKSILKAEAIKNGYQTFEVPDDIGGRFSVFSDVGLLPAAMAGIDIEQLMKGAQDMSVICRNTSDLKNNPAASQALVHKIMYDRGKHYSVMMPYSDKLGLIPDFYAQAWGESLGKKVTKENGEVVNVNHSPIKTVGAVDQHSQLQLWREGANDKVFTTISVKNFNNTVPITVNPANVPPALSYLKNNTVNNLIREEEKATREVLIKDQRPVMNIEIPRVDAYHVGQLMQMFLIQTALVGELQGLGVNTFLQPAVEDGKIIATKRMAEISEQNS